MRNTASKPPDSLKPRRFFQLRLAPPPRRDVQHPKKGALFTAQGPAMHLYRRIDRLIRRGKPYFNRRRRRWAGKGDGDDLAHRALVCFRE
jgi:hypothetical protein